ncbi:MAG TPA: hypothetical protein VFR24_13725 [Candidatus Angelobacter sp.]|nr:hypothetical protein [Candidatus Angelobacter sp.]
MNLRYLGDALDHWKGSLFESLQNANVLANFAVDPMCTDPEAWQSSDFSFYARLLHIRAEQIVRHEHTLRERKAYFTEIKHQGDLFLDPDTGISTSATNSQYLRPREIGELLERVFERILVIYQHVRAQKCAIRIDNVISAVESRIDRFRWCSYESPTVAMLFMSRSSRIHEVVDHFKTILGKHAETRIRGSHLIDIASSASV